MIKSLSEIAAFENDVTLDSRNDIENHLIIL